LSARPAPPWRVHAVLPRSAANGPGLRFVIWSQGCTLACPGCFNPQTHPPAGKTQTAAGLAAAALAAAALPGPGHGLEGVTLTGGEPLEQPAAVADFCTRIRAASDLGIIISTGFTRHEIETDRARSEAARHADMIIAGRYNARRHLGTGLRGSDNKAYWARTGRYSPADFGAVPDVELVIAPDGTVTLTGLPDVAGLRDEARA
jgi:anaerobic ribonucleoside-triphosphate reductase activating protein